MAIPEKWPRWIFASASDHFDGLKQSLTLVIAGMHRTDVAESELLELHFNGPKFNEVSKDYYHITLDVTMIVQTFMDDEDFHKHEKHIGIGVACFTNMIVKEYGDGGADLMCMKLISPVDVTKLGQIKPEVKLQQAILTATYEGTLYNV